MTQDRPTAAELVTAVREFLERDVMAATEGRVQFHARVAVNVLNIVARELELGDGFDAGERARPRALLGHDGDAPRPRARAGRGASGRARSTTGSTRCARTCAATVREKLLDRQSRLPPRRRPRKPPARMRIATWNVNSLKARLPRVEEFLGYADVDVLCLQETKLVRQDLPGADVLRRSATSRCTTARASGTASRSSPGSASTTSPTASTTQHVDPYEGDARVVAADCGGVRVVSVYVPNGREVGTDFYDRKLVWLQTLHDWLAATHTPDDPLVVLGDFNVAPEDRDVWDPEEVRRARRT